MDSTIHAVGFVKVVVKNKRREDVPPEQVLRELNEEITLPEPRRQLAPAVKQMDSAIMSFDL